MWKEMAVAYFEEISWKLSEKTEKNHERLWSIWPVPEPRSELINFQMGNKNPTSVVV
jgi:hypothetical protein